MAKDVEVVKGDSRDGSFTGAQMAAMMEAMAINIAREMKKPSEFEQQKMDEEKLKRERMAMARVEVGKAEAERRTADQERCPHVRWDGDGKPSLSGQHFSDGTFKVICVRCAKIVRTFVPAQTEMTMASQPVFM